MDALPTRFGQDNAYYNIVHFVKKLRNWIQNNGDLYRTKKSKKPQQQKQQQQQQPQPHQQEKQTSKAKNSKNAKNKTTKPSAKKASANTNDIFEKIRMAASGNANSIMMRDNSSPVHLFQKLSIQEELAAAEPEPAPLTLKDHLLAFCESLKRIRVRKSVIRTAVSNVVIN